MNFETSENQIRFTVACPTLFGQAVYISGNCDQLGNWNPQQALRMNWSEQNLWWCVASLPSNTNVEYKYYVADYEQGTNNVCWEQTTNRVLNVQDTQTYQQCVIETFNFNMVLDQSQTQNGVENFNCNMDQDESQTQNGVENFNWNMVQDQQQTQNVVETFNCNTVQDQPQTQNVVETDAQCQVPTQETPHQQLNCKQQSPGRSEVERNDQERTQLMSSSTCNSERSLSSPEKTEVPSRDSQASQPSQSHNNNQRNLQSDAQTSQKTQFSQCPQTTNTENRKMNQSSTSQSQSQNQTRSNKK
ncbi:hypothetical protein ABPG74_019417 [Tetrahymena malaccensis]